MKDKQGREYARLSQINEGDAVQVDGDFTCIDPWAKLTVQRDKDGLFVPCRCGGHHLAGQADNGDDCIGVYRA